MKRIFDGKFFHWSVLYPKYPNIFDIAKICFIIVLISVDHASVSWALFYKVLETISVPLKINYLAIVSSLYLLVFVKERGRTSPKWAIRGGMKRVSKKRNVKRRLHKGANGNCYIGKKYCQKCGFQKEIKMGGWIYRGGIVYRRGFKLSEHYSHVSCI